MAELRTYTVTKYLIEDNEDLEVVLNHLHDTNVDEDDFPEEVLEYINDNYGECYGVIRKFFPDRSDSDKNNYLLSGWNLAQRKATVKVAANIVPLLELLEEECEPKYTFAVRLNTTYGVVNHQRRTKYTDLERLLFRNIEEGKSEYDHKSIIEKKGSSNYKVLMREFVHDDVINPRQKEGQKEYLDYEYHRDLTVDGFKISYNGGVTAVRSTDDSPESYDRFVKFVERMKEEGRLDESKTIEHLDDVPYYHAIVCNQDR